LKVTLPAMPFDIPPKPRELTPPAPSRVLAVRKIDANLIGDEGGDFIDPVDGDEVPMGKRTDWVTPEPND